MSINGKRASVKNYMNGNVSYQSYVNKIGVRLNIRKDATEAKLSKKILISPNTIRRVYAPAR